MAGEAEEKDPNYWKKEIYGDVKTMRTQVWEWRNYKMMKTMTGNWILGKWKKKSPILCASDFYIFNLESHLQSEVRHAVYFAKCSKSADWESAPILYVKLA